MQSQIHNFSVEQFAKKRADKSKTAAGQVKHPYEPRRQYNGERKPLGKEKKGENVEVQEVEDGWSVMKKHKRKPKNVVDPEKSSEAKKGNFILYRRAIPVSKVKIIAILIIFKLQS